MGLFFGGSSSGTSLGRQQIETAINSISSLDTHQKTYLLGFCDGFFLGTSERSLSREEIDKVIARIKDNMGDDINSDEAEKFKDALLNQIKTDN